MRIGALQLSTPVILAPMAGVTHYPFRHMCQQFGASLCMSEMLTARCLLEGNTRSRIIAAFGPDEQPRSLQLYTTDPVRGAEAVAYLRTSHQPPQHIDLNFGCPMPKITRRGGGAALPLNIPLFTAIIRAVVTEAGDIPVTIKLRKGINDHTLYYLRAAAIAEANGVAAVTLHARTADQLYAGRADWHAIKQLKASILSIPILGNGDIWSGNDAIRMMHQTACDGVMIGRGCLGRPWLFAEVRDRIAGKVVRSEPSLADAIAVMRHLLSLMCPWFGPEQALRLFKKHIKWFLYAFEDKQCYIRSLLAAGCIEQIMQLLTYKQDARQQPDLTRPHPLMNNKTQRVILPYALSAGSMHTAVLHAAEQNISSG